MYIMSRRKRGGNENSKSKLVINTINQMLQKSQSKELEEEDIISLYHFEQTKNRSANKNL